MADTPPQEPKKASIFDRTGHAFRHRFKRQLAAYHRHIILVTVLLIAIVAAIFFASGLFVAKTVYTGQYFAQHYVANVPVPKTASPVRVQGRVSLPTTGSINLRYYPSVGDQGTVGACAAWSTAWALSFEYRLAHPGWWIKFSPRCMYDHYSDTYNNGQDGGSWPDQDAEGLATTGVTRFSTVPYGPNTIGLPAYSVDNPIPSLCQHTTYRSSVTFDVLQGFSAGGGQGLVDSIETAITQGYPVLIAIPVYPEFDNAGYTNGNVVSPRAGETSRGGHSIAVIAFDNSRPMPDGSTGAVEIQNQWSTYWGLHGRGWLSLDFVRRYVFGAEVPHLAVGSGLETHRLPPHTVGISGHGGREHPSPSAPLYPFLQALKHYLPSNAPLHHAPKLPKGLKASNPNPGVAATSWYVHGVYTHDTRENLTNQFNYWGDYYGVAPLGLVATAQTESGINAVADHYGYGVDVSFGLMQFTEQTLCYYAGVCSNARAYEDNPDNMIPLAARFFRDLHIQTCVLFPNLYAAYNQGGGYGCYASQYLYPQGQAGSNYAAFLGNWNYVSALYGGGTPPGPSPRPQPKPQPKFTFPYVPFESYRDAHHLHRISPFAGPRRLTWPASMFTRNRWVGGIRYKGEYHWRGLRHPYMKYGFAHGTCYGYMFARTSKCVR